MNSSRTQFHILSASAVGTILEWYDFSLFAYLTPLLAIKFFPKHNQLTALMLTYSIFAVGYFVRPIGAIVFGHCGDRYGRKITLVWSIVLMSFCTIAMGLLPTYSSIGILAPALLILLRVGQGFSAGGESSGAVIFSLESVPEKHRGFFGALLWSMTGVGMLLGSLAATIVLQYDNHPWLWRIPFLLGLISGIIGYYLRRNTPESSQYQRIVREHQLKKYPLWSGIKQYPVTTAGLIGLYILSAMITYLIFIFMPTYTSNIIGLPLTKTTTISTAAFLCSTIMVPLGGYLSDRTSRATCLVYSAFGLIFLSYPLFLLITQNQISYLIFSLIIFIILSGIFQGALTAAVFELLPTPIRYSVSATAYNISYALFGGTAPLVATYLVNLTGNKAAPGVYLTLGAIVAVISLNVIYKHRD